MFADVIQSLVDAQEAYHISTDGELRELIFSDICGKILVNMSQKLHHVEWYSRFYEAREFEEYNLLYPIVKEVSDFLEDKGYICLISQFTPSLKRSTYRVRLYVTWELADGLESGM